MSFDDYTRRIRSVGLRGTLSLRSLQNMLFCTLDDGAVDVSRILDVAWLIVRVAANFCAFQLLQPRELCDICLVPAGLLTRLSATAFLIPGACQTLSTRMTYDVL